jgi:hypothetical protein
MDFCIRDDDTCFFTTPEALESAYEGIQGPVSLAVIPFCRAGKSGFIPERYKRKWSIHPLHENPSLVEYLRKGVSQGRYEVMLHGYHHDEPNGRLEFAEQRTEPELIKRVAYGRKYLEDLIGAAIRVFVPPGNGLSGPGLDAIVRGGLHLAGAAGVQGGWKKGSLRTWQTWLHLRRWSKDGGLGIPWILDMGDHREIHGNPVTPSSRLDRNQAIFDSTRTVGGSFCAATHYWEFSAKSIHPGDPDVGNQLRRLIDRAVQDPNVNWRSVGDTLTQCRTLF